MSAIATSFISGSRLRGSGGSVSYPCRRNWPEGRPKGLPAEKVICANRVLAKEFEVDALTVGELRSERLLVQDVVTGRAFVGSHPLPGGVGSLATDAFTSSAALVVNGNTLLCHHDPVDFASGAVDSALLVVDGSVTLYSSSSSRPAKLSAKCETREVALVLDVAFNDASGCSQLADYFPISYSERGPGLSAEIKNVQALLSTCPSNQLSGWLETKTLSGIVGGVPGGVPVMQTLTTSVLEGWGTTGVFHRTSIADDKWSAWFELAGIAVG